MFYKQLDKVYGAVERIFIRLFKMSFLSGIEHSVLLPAAGVPQPVQQPAHLHQTKPAAAEAEAATKPNQTKQAQ